MAPKKKSQVAPGGFTPEELADAADAAEAATPLGAPHPAPIALAPSTIPNPNRSEAEQLMEMKPVIVGPPGYGSPDPLTSMGRLVPLEQHPLRDTLVAEDYGEGYGANLTALETLAPSPGPGTGEGTEGTPSAEAEDDESGEGASPAAVKLAAENNVDLDDVTGTGVDGKVTKPDVQNFIDDRDDD